MMPGLNGLEVLKILREAHTATDLPIIMATALGESEDVVTPPPASSDTFPPAIPDRCITRRFCQMMGGDMTVHSSPGEGSIFTVTLPAVVDQAKPEASAEAASVPPNTADADDAEPLPPANTCVLVIDDELCDIPVIMLTVVDDCNRGFTLGASEYATKPVELPRLLGKIEALLSPEASQ
jgi:CheY-like chemotaxis protein